MKRVISDKDTSRTHSSSDASGPSIQINPVVALYPQYKVSELLSSGGCGSVYLAVDDDFQKYAIKIQKHDPANPMLQHELAIFKRIFLNPRTRFPSFGFPIVYNYLLRFDHEFLVMERLGDSLRKKLDARPSKRFSKKTGLMIGIQVVRRLQMLHENHVLHRDIKPHNLVMGLAPDDQTVHIIDFGVSKIVENWESYNPDEECSFAGTLHYAPIEALYKKLPTRAGDLQSLAYSLIAMVTGTLPWVYENTQFNRRLSLGELGIQRIRKRPAELCADFPELTQFVKFVRRIRNNTKPNYEMLVRELQKGLKTIGCQNDGLFDWLIEQSPEANTEAQEPVQQEAVQQEAVQQEPVQQEHGEPLTNVECNSPTPTVEKQAEDMAQAEVDEIGGAEDIPESSLPTAVTVEGETVGIEEPAEEILEVSLPDAAIIEDEPVESVAPGEDISAPAVIQEDETVGRDAPPEDIPELSPTPEVTQEDENVGSVEDENIGSVAPAEDMFDLSSSPAVTIEEDEPAGSDETAEDMPELSSTPLVIEEDENIGRIAPSEGFPELPSTPAVIQEDETAGRVAPAADIPALPSTPAVIQEDETAGSDEPATDIPELLMPSAIIKEDEEIGTDEPAEMDVECLIEPAPVETPSEMKPDSTEEDRSGESVDDKKCLKPLRCMKKCGRGMLEGMKKTLKAVLRRAVNGMSNRSGRMI